LPEKAFFAGGFLEAHRGVYLPSDDSFLLADSIPPCNCEIALDMGCGSGIQAINLALKGARSVIAADINARALKDTEMNAARFGLSPRISAVRSDLFSALRGRKFDIIAFNPPYVPGDGIELRDVDGGKNGREVIDRFLAEFAKHLNRDGECYLLQSSLNRIALTRGKLRAQGISCGAVARKRLFFEELSVLRCTHAFKRLD